MAVSGRPLGAIWAGYLFAPNIKTATWQNGWGAQRFDRDQQRSYGASDNLIMDWQPRYLFAGYFFARRAGLWPWTGVIMVTVGAARVSIATAPGG